MNQEYFAVQLSPTINLGIPLESMGTVVQLEVNNVCTVPGVADFWYGVVNFKGSLLWVLDSDRYFELENHRDVLNRQLTAIILKQQVEQSPRKIALITQKILGITSLEVNSQQESNNSIASNLDKCSLISHVRGEQTTYILNPVNLLQQLHQESSLISA